MTIKVIPSDMLPAGTMIVSPDIYQILQQVPQKPKAEPCPLTLILGGLASSAPKEEEKPCL